MDGLTDNPGIKTVWQRFYFRDNCLSFTHGFGVCGYGVSTAPVRLRSHTP